MTVDLARVTTLMDAVKRTAMEIPLVYQAGGSPLATEQQALQLFRKVAAMLSEVLVIAPAGSIRYAVAEKLHAKVVSQLIDSARACTELERIESIMSEARGQTLH